MAYPHDEGEPKASKVKDFVTTGFGMLFSLLFRYFFYALISSGNVFYDVLIKRY